MRYVFSIGIQIVDNCVGVTGMASRKDNHFKGFAETLQDLSSKWPDIDASCNNLPIWERYRQLNIVLRFGLVAVDESFVQVEDDCFTILIAVMDFQNNFFSLDLDFLWLGDFFHKVYCLDRLKDVLINWTVLTVFLVLRQVA